MNVAQFGPLLNLRNTSGAVSSIRSGPSLQKFFVMVIAINTWDSTIRQGTQRTSRRIPRHLLYQHPKLRPNRTRTHANTCILTIRRMALYSPIARPLKYLPRKIKWRTRPTRRILTGNTNHILRHLLQRFSHHNKTNVFEAIMFISKRRTNKGAIFYSIVDGNIKA